MTKSKIAAALATLTLAATLSASTQAQAHHAHWGAGLGIGLAAGALIGAAAASNAYYAAQPYEYANCRYVERYDRWGNVRTVRVCDVDPY